MIASRIQKALKKKQGDNKKLFLILCHYYKKHLKFHDSLNDLKEFAEEDLVLFEDIQVRMLERYKSEIRYIFQTQQFNLRADFTTCFKTVGSFSKLSDEEIRRRILVVIYGIGTNLGLKRVAQLASLTIEELRHIKRYFLTCDQLRDAIKTICNKVFEGYDEKIFGKLSKGLCADATQMSAYEDNLVTLWNGKYKDTSVMVYWHLTLDYICVFSQLHSCRSSEVARMLHGFLHHNTTFEAYKQYVDSHGKSDLGFALSLLLNFELLPRIKDIGRQKLYRPYAMELKNLERIVEGTIKWDLIEEHYDEMLQIICALRQGKTSPDSIIRQFSSTNFTSPLFKAFKELGRCQRTIFLCRYLSSKPLREEINASLNIVENWNSMVHFVRFIGQIDMTNNSTEEMELSMLCTHLIQLSITYINMLIIQQVAKETSIKPEDKVSLVFYKHFNPLGLLDLSFKKRLNIGGM